MMRVSESWDDALWAKFRALVDVRVESELRLNADPHRHEPVPLPPWYGQDDLTPEKIFADLRTSQSSAVSEAAKEPMHVVQRWVVGEGRWAEETR